MANETAAYREEAPDYPGFHYEWLPDDAWAVGGDGRTCRMLHCGKPAVAKLKRSRRTARLGRHWTWWHYCEDHLYGRRIREGVVECHCLRPNSEEDAARARG